MLAAVDSVRHRKAEKVIVAVPVASSSSYHLVREKADEVISLIIAETPYFAVASFYHHWYDLSEQGITPTRSSTPLTSLLAIYKAVSSMLKLIF